MTFSALFFGTPEFAVPSLQALLDLPECQVKAVITQPDRPAGRGNRLTPSAIKVLAQQHNIPVIQPERIRKSLPEFLSRISQYGPIDVGVVVAFGQILPKEVLAYPRCGCINVHGSLLPRWRGAAPMQRAIMAGDSETGVCLMQMDEGLDTGAVFSTRALALTDTDTLENLHDRLSTEGASLLKADIPHIINGQLTAITQSTQGITYAHKITSEEAHIQWDKPAHHVLRSIHGLSPFPGAFSLLDGKRLKVFRCEIANEHTPPSSNAAVGRLSADLVVQTGLGQLRLLEVQLEGKKRLGREDFLRGQPLKEATILR